MSNANAAKRKAKDQEDRVPTSNIVGRIRTPCDIRTIQTAYQVLSVCCTIISTVGYELGSVVSNVSHTVGYQYRYHTKPSTVEHIKPQKEKGSNHHPGVCGSVDFVGTEI
jgi:hypothetical protein